MTHVPQDVVDEDTVDQGILNEVWKHKLIFVETPDANETSIALENYRRVRFRIQIVLAITLSHHTFFFRHVITDVVLFCFL